MDAEITTSNGASGTALAALQADVDQNESDSDAAETALQTNINTLTSNVATNATTAATATAAVQANVNANETASNTANTTLQNNINSLSTTTNAAIVLKENAANKSTDVSTDGASDVKFPTVKSVKTYVDAEITTSNATNANLTGPITSNGNATAIASQTGTGSKFVMDTAPTLVTPVLGVATATSVNGTSIPTSKTLVVTTDKLNVLAATTSVELAGVISDETGTGNIVLSNSPTFTGTPSFPAGTIGTTQAAGDNTTALATTAFVTAASTTNANGIAALEAEVFLPLTLLNIGDFVGGGVVFWIDPSDNTKGLVCSVNDIFTASNGANRWSNSAKITTGATGISIGSGLDNTSKIINIQGAGDYAASSSSAYRGGGYSDWFFPSKEELNQIFLNKNTINSASSSNGGANLNNSWYWSSSETGFSTAWIHHFGTNQIQDFGKDATLYVRAVRNVSSTRTSSLSTLATEQTAQNTAIGSKEDKINKSIDGTFASNSDVLFPTEKATKTYVDNQIASGNAATVTTNANLTGPITSNGNATAIASQTGTGSTFVMSASPTIGGTTTLSSVIINSTLNVAGTTALSSTLSVAGVATFNGNVIGIDKTKVGLGNVDNTSDASKPVSIATQTALNLKEDAANKSTDVTLADATNVNFPTELAVKTYVDAAINTSNTTNANLTGVVTSTGNATSIANGAITNTMLANGAVANLTGTNTGDQTNITGNAATATNVTGIVAVANGGTGSNTKNFVDLASSQSITGNKSFASDISVNGLKIGNGGGSQSTVIGDTANATQANNTALGFMTLNGNSGADNTAVGTNAMRNSGNTSYNTAIGENSGTGVNTGTGNTYLGYNANVTSNSSISNATAIGSGAIITSSNTIQLGADGTNGTTAISNVNTSGSYSGSGFKTPTGTAAQFLKADGSVDSSTYLTSAGTATNVSGVVAVANGGTGAAALTGYIKGNGTSTMTASATIPVSDVSGAAPLASPTFNGTVAGIDKTMVGLGNVDNTSDASKPVSTATQTELNIKENTANKSTDVTLADATNVKFPTELAVKTYVDAAINTSNATNANLTGVVTSTGNATSIANGAITNTMLANGAVANLTGTNTGDQTNITGNAATATNVTGIVAVANGGTGSNTKNFVDLANSQSITGTKTFTRKIQVFAQSYALTGTMNIGFPSSGENLSAIAIGINALNAHRYGQQVIGIGNEALYNDLRGVNNIALGNKALYTTVNNNDNNIAIGASAGYVLNNGDYNIYIGNSAGSSHATGDKNILLGASSAASSSTASNQIVIGYGATGAADNTVQLGNTAITNVKTSGTITAGAITYPNAHGLANQVLQTNGSGTLSWANAAVDTDTQDLSLSGNTVSLVDGGSVDVSTATAVAANTAKTGLTTAQTTLLGNTSGTNTGDQDISGIATNATNISSNAANIATNVTAIALNTAKTSVPDDSSANSGQVLQTNGSGTLSWATPSTTATAYSGVLPVANGGTGSSTQNFVDLTTAQTIAGVKSFSSPITVKSNTLKGDGSGSVRNVGLGLAVFNSTVSGTWNTGMGAYAFERLTSGSQNTAIGNETLSFITTTSNNTGIGNRAIMNTTGSNNTALGSNAAVQLLTGDNNLILGNSSGSQIADNSNLTSLSNSVLMGSGARTSANGGTNEIVIGYNAVGNGSNTIQLGNTVITNVKTSGTLTAGTVTYPNAHNSIPGQVLTTDGGGLASWGSPAASVTEIADEYTNTTGVATERLTADKRSFTLTQAPSANSKVKMYVNGIRISNTAYSVSGSTLTYVPANNGSYALTASDRIQFDYFY